MNQPVESIPLDQLFKKMGELGVEVKRERDRARKDLVELLPKILWGAGDDGKN